MTRSRGPKVELVPLLEDKVAHSAPVRADITRRGKARQAASEARHAARRDTGASFVSGGYGDADYTIELDDTRGDGNALAIEFGTDRVGSGGRGTFGTFTLTGVSITVGGGDA